MNEVLKLIANLIRMGTVDSVDATAGTVVIRWPSGVTSRAMPWAITSASFYAEPVAGDQATVLSPGGDPATAIAFCGVASTDADRGNKSAAARSDLVSDELDKVKTQLEGHEHLFAWLDPAGNSQTTGNNASYSKQGVEANFVKVD